MAMRATAGLRGFRSSGQGDVTVQRTVMRTDLTALHPPARGGLIRFGVDWHLTRRPRWRPLRMDDRARRFDKLSARLRGDGPSRCRSDRERDNAVTARFLVGRRRSPCRSGRARLLTAAALLAALIGASIGVPGTASAIDYVGCATVKFWARSSSTYEVGILATGCGIAGVDTFELTGEISGPDGAPIGSWHHGPGPETFTLADRTYTNMAYGTYTLLLHSRYMSPATGQPVENTFTQPMLTPLGPGFIGVSGPVTRFAGGSMSSGAVPARVSWTNATGGSVRYYELQRQSDDGAWTTMGRSTGASASVLFAPGHRYRFRARALSVANYLAPWSAGPVLAVAGYPETSSAFARTGTWTASNNPLAWGGAYKSSTETGATSTLSITARAVAVVATVGPSFGLARVVVDGVTRTTVNLHASAVGYRRIVYSLSWTSAAAHTVELVVVGTTGHPRVSIDGVMALE